MQQWKWHVPFIKLLPHSKNKRFVFGSFSQTHAVVSGQRNFHTKFRKCPPHTQLLWSNELTGCFCAIMFGPSTDPAWRDGNKDGDALGATDLWFFSVGVYQSQNLLPSHSSKPARLKTALNRNSAIYKEGMLQSVCVELEHRPGICSH